jgi:LemA protein
MKYLSTIIPIGLVVILLFGLYGLFVGFQTSAITLSENAKESWGNVESSYQRRNDLIGNLVNTVKGAADFEKNTLTAVIEARAKATSTTIDISKATPSQIAAFQNNQGVVSSSLSRLLVSVERYPELRANENFLRLQNELTGTENRIKFARDKYNATIKPYNIHITTFPNSSINNMVFHFIEMPYYKSDMGADKAPKVEFNF